MPVPITPRKLWDHIETAYNELQWARDLYDDNWRRWVTRHLHDQAGPEEPLPLIHFAISVLCPNVCPPTMAYRTVAKTMMLRGEAKVLSQAQTQIARENDLAMQIRDAFTDACLGPIGGVMKCGIKAGAEMVKVSGRLLNRGQFYGKTLHPGDWAADPSARTEDEWTWECHKYRLPRGLAMEAGIFPRDVIARLPAFDDDSYLGGENTDEWRGGAGRWDLFDVIELIDGCIYGGDTSWAFTLPSSPGFVSDYLYLEEYQGPERGPYYHLGFRRMRKRPLYIPLVAVWRDLADILNLVGAKVMRNVADAKSVLAYSRGAVDDAKTVMEAADRAAVAVDDVNALKDIPVGMVHKDLAPFMQQGMSWWNLLSGNIQLLGGTSPDTSTETLGELKQMMGTAGVQTRDVTDITNSFKTKVGQHILWDLTTDPLKQFGDIQRIPGGQFIDVYYDAATRQGKFWHFSTNVIPVVVENLEPAVRVDRLFKLAGVAPQLAELHMATGGLSPYPAWMRIFADELGVEEIDELATDPTIAMMQQALLQPAGQPTQGQAAGPTPGLNQQAASYRTRPARGEPEQGGGETPQRQLPAGAGAGE